MPDRENQVEYDQLAPALVKAQSLIKPAIKDAENPFFKSSYADLASIWEACGDALHAEGIAVLQPLGNINGAPCINTILMHESGQFLATQLPLNPPKDDPQAMGSYITYMRRYGLASAVGVVTSDDDGEAAMQRSESKKPQEPTPEEMNEVESRKLLAKDLAYVLELDLNKLSTKDKGAMKLKLQQTGESHGYKDVDSIQKLSGLKLEAIANTIADEAFAKADKKNENQ